MRFPTSGKPTICVDSLSDSPRQYGSSASTTAPSTDPGSDLFHGSAPFSEAETKNVRWLFDNYPRIRRFIDIHFSGGILHPWGDHANQSTTALKNFTNPVWNGKHGVDGDAYAEYIGAGDLTAMQTAGNQMKAAIASVRGESYNVAQSFFMPGWSTTYPTSGASDDWVFSRHYAGAAKPRVLGYVLEFNKIWGQFFPTWAEMEKSSSTWMRASSGSASTRRLPGSGDGSSIGAGGRTASGQSGSASSRPSCGVRTGHGAGSGGSSARSSNQSSAR